MNNQIKDEITFDILEKIDIRVGTILSVEKVINSRKLVKLIVDFGEFQRQILVGMQGERENLQEIVGEQSLFVLNLPEKTMGGEVSQGMLFDIGYASGITPVLAKPEKPVPNGTKVG